MSYPRSSRIGGRLRWVGLFGLIAALSLSLLLITGAPNAANGQDETTANVAKKKKKKKKPVKVMTQNLYAGASLEPIIEAANAGQPGPVTGAADPNQCGFPSSAAILACTAQRVAAGDNFINEVGFALKDVETNDFNIRARTIANQIKKHKPDLVGLQEVALFKIEIPTDGGGPPRGTPATVPLIDFSDTLLNTLNKKAMSKKQCKKKGLKGDKCFRGYKQVTLQQEADIEQPGDFDNDPGPNGIGGNGPAFDTTGPPFPFDGATPKPGPPCFNGFDDGVPGPPAEGPNDPETNPGGDDTGVFAQDPGPPNPQFPSGSPVNDPITGQPAPFDWNGDSSSNYQNNGNIPGTQALSCGPDTTAGIFGVTPPDPTDGYSYASDCPDNNPIGGESEGPDDKSDTTSSCVFHGIDGDARLQLRDAILVRKGAGVKTTNPQGGNYTNTLEIPIFGGSAVVRFVRGWTSVDATVRGKKLHFLNTHLEDIEAGTVREDQAAELVQPSAPGAVNKTVLVGDLNSDPSIDPGPDPVNDNAESNIAFNRLAAAGYTPVTGSFNTYGHAEILNNPNDNTFTKRIDWIMTNSPSITLRSSRLVNAFANGLWGSDHGGILSVLNVPGGKKGKKK